MSSHAELEEMFPRENLDPELEPFLTTTSDGIEHLKHPLVFQVFYNPLLAGRCNQMLAYKKNAVANAIKEKNWFTFIFLHERPHRVDALLHVASRVVQGIYSELEYWDLARAIWIDSENLWQWGDSIEKVLLNPRYPNHRLIMNQADQHALYELPDPFVIYRGHQEINKLGWSWTTDPGRAEWFAKRFAELHGASEVTEAIVKKSDIIAYIPSARDESEVIINPRNL